MEELAHRYPGWPLWGLVLAEHLRDRLGAYAESAAVARRILGAGDAARPEAGAAALALARLSLGESLLLDLRPEEARHALLPLLGGETGSALARGAGSPARRAQPRASKASGKAPSPTIAPPRRIATRGSARRPPLPISSPRRRSTVGSAWPGPGARARRAAARKRRRGRRKPSPPGRRRGRRP